MKCSPALSRYSVCVKSITRPAAVCTTELWSAALSSPAFDMSTSPRMRATGLPACSSNWTSASIAVPLQRTAQFDSGTCVLTPDDHFVHQRLHQLQAAAAILAARLAPGAVVSDGHGDVALAARRLEVEAGLTRRVRVLDRVRTSLAGRERDVVERLGVHA